MIFRVCGGGEIRTHDPLARIPLFKSGAFNHSSHSSVFTSLHNALSHDSWDRVSLDFLMHYVLYFYLYDEFRESPLYYTHISHTVYPAVQITLVSVFDNILLCRGDGLYCTVFQFYFYLNRPYCRSFYEDWQE